MTNRTMLPMDVPIDRLIVISLPLPHDNLHPNARPYWRAKAENTKICRKLAELKASPKRPREPFQRASFRLAFKLPRLRDEDGLLSWCKAYIDGIADAGIIINDSRLHFDGMVRTSGRKATGGIYSVTFVIWED